MSFSPNYPGCAPDNRLQRTRPDQPVTPQCTLIFQVDEVDAAGRERGAAAEASEAGADHQHIVPLAPHRRLTASVRRQPPDSRDEAADAARILGVRRAVGAQQVRLLFPGLIADD